jgi:sulfofructose kinase
MEAAQEAVIWASQNNVPVVADLKENIPGIDKLLPYINYLIIPDFFAVSLTESEDKYMILHSLKKMINGIPVITEGSKGGTYLLHDQVRNYRVFHVDCIDSTGAGDAFHGAFCHFLALKYPLENCLDLASAAGALNCRSVGGRKGLPDISTLTDLINKSANLSSTPKESF